MMTTRTTTGALSVVSMVSVAPGYALRAVRVETCRDCGEEMDVSEMSRRGSEYVCHLCGLYEYETTRASEAPAGDVRDEHAGCPMCGDASAIAREDAEFGWGCPGCLAAAEAESYASDASDDRIEHGERAW